MSTLQVTTIQTANNTTNLTITTGSGTGSKMVLDTAGNIGIGNTTANTLTVNGSALAVTSNLIANSSGLYLGNATVNSVVSGSGLIVGNATVNAVHTSSGLTVGSNVTVNATGVYVGNATVNAVHSATQLSIANSTANVQLGLTVSGGFSVNAYNIGVVSSGNTTPAPGNGNYQYMIANGAFTMVAPATDCAIDIYLLNGSAAGSITFSGYTVSAAPGSPYATTNANKYVLSIRRINSVSTYSWYAMQ